MCPHLIIALFSAGCRYNFLSSEESAPGELVPRVADFPVHGHRKGGRENAGGDEKAGGGQRARKERRGRALHQTSRGISRHLGLPLKKDVNVRQEEDTARDGVGPVGAVSEALQDERNIWRHLH